MTSNTIQEYKNKKEQLQTQLEAVKRDIILKEQTISQQEEIFTQQFGTTDESKLKEISDSYIQQIQAKEAELANLNIVV